MKNVTFSQEELELAKRMSYKNWEMQDETKIGFEHCGQWITNPFIECSGRWELTDFDAMCAYYGKENVGAFIAKILDEGKSLLMTREQKIELCTIYNNSDIDALTYMQQFCSKEQLELLNRLVTLTAETDIGLGNEPSTSEEVDEYHQGKWKLLIAFGLESVDGNAYFDGVFYQ